MIFKEDLKLQKYQSLCNHNIPFYIQNLSHLAQLERSQPLSYNFQKHERPVTNRKQNKFLFVNKIKMSKLPYAKMHYSFHQSSCCNETWQ